MSLARLLLTVLVIFVLSVVFGTLIHAFLLKDDYMQVSQLYRTAMDTKFVFIWLAYLAFAIGSVWVYSKGVEDGPWLGQGLRFGLAMWLILSIPSFLIAYATQPIPESLVMKQTLYELVDKLVLGVVTALMLRR